MKDPLYRHRGMGCSRQSCLMLSAELVVLALVFWRLGGFIWSELGETASLSLSSPPPGLTLRDVLPTPTPDITAPVRMITFPGALMSAPIIPAGRVQGTWETRHLGDSVGHLVGTSWLDDPGGNIVLAGHVESSTGSPGPFAHLFEAAVGDLVILREGIREQHYRVTAVEEADPYDIGFVAQDGRQRLTLITCTDWDNEQETYLGRLIVIAEPVVSTTQSSGN